MRGFIDVFRRVYTISGDTKVVSKLIELMLLPAFKDFADKHGYNLVLAREQNQYPDMSFVRDDSVMFAVDLKSTYRKEKADKVNTMTLGAFSGYFRDRTSDSKVTFPYGHYSGHFVLGLVYDRAKLKANELMVHHVEELGMNPSIEIAQALENKVYTAQSLEEVPAVVRNLEFFAQPRYKIAIDRPGSGNTKNIGAVGSLKQLIEGAGPFAKLGKETFDDYWMNYLTNADAKLAELQKPPYSNLAEYTAYRRLDLPDKVLAEAVEVAEEDAAEIDDSEEPDEL